MGKPIRTVVLWLTVLCSVVGGYQHFERTHLGRWRQQVPKCLYWQTKLQSCATISQVQDCLQNTSSQVPKLPHASQNMKMVSNKIYGHNYNLQLQWLAGWLAAPQYGIFLRKPIYRQLSKFYILQNPLLRYVFITVKHSMLNTRQLNKFKHSQLIDKPF